MADACNMLHNLFSGKNLYPIQNHILLQKRSSQHRVPPCLNTVVRSAMPHLTPKVTGRIQPKSLFTMPKLESNKVMLF